MCFFRDTSLRPYTWHFLACILSLFAAPVAAAEFLTAELRFVDEEFGNFGTNPPSTLMVNFSIGEQFLGRWSREISSADVGQTFVPDPDQLALMARGIRDDADGNIGFGVGFGPNLNYELYEMTLLGAGYDNASLTLHVPALETYPLTSVTITIDELAIIQDVSSWRYRGGLTARLYGVPEPASSLLVALCLISLSIRPTSRCRRFGRFDLR